MREANIIALVHPKTEPLGIGQSSSRQGCLWASDVRLSSSGSINERAAARSVVRWLAMLAALVVVGLGSPAARAQDAETVPERSRGWDSASTAMALSAAGIQLLMPRVFYSDPEVTVGWKARWHVSVLAPSMTLAALTLINEQWLKDAFKGHRPGCDDANRDLSECSTYGMMSSEAQLAFSALGQGTGVFLVDTIKWSGGRFNGGAFAGHVGVPLALALLTTIGRSAGNLETAGQAWAGAGAGFVSGIGMGVLYALMQRPECGYGGSLICW